MWYGIFITLGIFLGAVAAFRNTKRNGIANDLFLDFIIIAVPVSLFFTRMYYVVFNMDLYRNNWGSIFAFRSGGMGVYGGIISAFATLFIYSYFKARKTKKGKTTEMAGRIGDTAVFGLLVGQIVGRLGNLVNQEAFGGYTDGLLAMQLRLQNISAEYGRRSIEFLQSVPAETVRAPVTYEMLQNAYTVGGDVVVLVHPTFLYEMLLNTGIFIFLWFFRGHKKFYGELLLIYAAAYAFGRFFIENLRTDQLFLWNTQIPASMFVSCVVFACAVVLITLLRIRAGKSGIKELTPDA